MGNIVADPKTYTVDWDASAAEKGGWDSFMDKEIHEGPAAVQRTLLGRLGKDGNLNLDEVRIDEHDFKAIDKIIVIACGTAATRAWWPNTPSSIGCVFRWKWSLPTNSVIVIRFSPAHVGGGHFAVR